MAKDDLYFRLRLPEDLKTKVSEAADSSHRSMTAEIIARLEASFQPAPSGNQFFGGTVIVEDIAAKIAEHLKADPGIIKITGEDAKLTVGRKKSE